MSTPKLAARGGVAKQPVSREICAERMTGIRVLPDVMAVWLT
ncbi:hypothetical protein [uncultured Litoreibacter sp.]|nr:hypothetical protein [uncultured Litoreibacter sp.]